ncbi:DNA polymerase III beta chain [Kribbella flavida DSM 17836]|uniref:DNA polymerase III beta chain n=1 Tax=Kribbella flavida (strain DSM 17836 / JCM 10339 / NBRC 14399) TaxID=479435 RepID=D2Q2C4_KRIFD|nr:MerR family transcriptional regulator [Kribbella flavida]ADB35820.1 DNA polymerase III beta chain [Kribbella flavida DSM 17836]
MVDDLVNISAFARRVGLTPSALRFYDDCDVLRPAVVDESNGYRYYAPEQEPRARLLRDLRAIDLPLPEVRRVLDGEPALAASVVETHLRTVEQKAAATRQAAARILGTLGVPAAAVRERGVTLGGPELASAIRQVTPSAAEGDELPVLACVRIELAEDEVTLVATDRYRLAVRKLHPQAFSGTPGAVLVRASELTELTRWVASAGSVQLDVTPTQVVLSRSEPHGALAGDVRELQVVEEEYPAYQAILEGLGPPVCRVLVDRLALAELLGAADVVALSIEPSQVTVEGSSPASQPSVPGGHLAALVSGEPLRIGFTARLLTAALHTGVGPDVLLEIHAPNRPVVIRSADQGTFTTLVMPTRLPEYT